MNEKNIYTNMCMNKVLYKSVDWFEVNTYQNVIVHCFFLYVYHDIQLYFESIWLNVWITVSSSEPQFKLLSKEQKSWIVTNKTTISIDNE